MRFKDKDIRSLSYSKPVTNKSGNHNNAINDKSEHEKLVASIASTRESIETSEKKYKDLINSRKRSEVAETVRGIPSLEPINCDDLIAAAKERLIRAKAKTEHVHKDRTSSDRDLEEKLKTLNENARKWFCNRRNLLGAGPKFKRHSFSPFGRVLLVTPISQNIFTIITSKNTVELWEIETEGSDQKSRIIEVYELPGYNLTCAIDLYHHECDNDNYDYLKNIPDQEKYLPGIRNTAWTTKKPQAKPKVVKQSDLPETSNTEAAVAEEETDDGYIRVPDLFLRRNSFMKAYDDLDSLAAAKLHSHDEAKKINWKTYPFPDAPKVHFRHMFFCGASNGLGMLIEVRSAYDPISRKTSTACQIRHQKSLSQNPIKIAFCKSLHDGTPIISTEVTTKSAEHFVVGFTLALEIEYACKCDTIRMTMADRCTRYISKELQMAISDDKKDTRAPEENLITAYAYDDIHSSLLLGTTGGTVVRLFYQKEKQTKRNADESEQKSGTPLKLVWCLELFPINSPSAPTDTPNASPPEAEKEAAESHIEITSVKQYLQPSSNQTFILIGASDGIIRTFRNDNLKVSPKPFIFYLDRFFRNDAKAGKEGKSFDSGFECDPIHCDCDYIGSDDGINLVVGVTSKNTLILYDPLDCDDIFLESQILSQTIASGKHADGEKACYMKILDSKRGIMVVYHGKYWSIVSLKETMEFRRMSFIKKNSDPTTTSTETDSSNNPSNSEALKSD